jgi:hypothetical protein
MRSILSDRFVSAPFIDDATFFVASIIPLVYVFEANPALLACAVHVLSVPCAGMGHSAKLSGPQTFALILAQTLISITDAMVAMFCVCQFTLSELCCETLAAAGVSCLERYQDVPLAVILLPVATFNLVRGSLRFYQICRASDGIKEIGLALNASIKATHLAVLVYAGADDDFASLLIVTELYSITSVLLAAANWKGFSEQALVTSFFVDYGILTLHARNSLMRSSPTLGVFFAFAALCVSSTLILSNPRYAESGDGWAKAMTLLVSIVFSYVGVAEWGGWAPFEGGVYVAYFGTAVVRCFIFGGDSLLNTRVAASVFAIVDVLAIVAIAAGDVIVKPDLYMKIIDSDAWKQVRDPENYIKIINYIKIVDGASTIIDADTYDGVADQDSYTQLFEADTYKKLIDNDAFRKITDPDTYKLLIEPDIYKWALQQVGVNGALCIGCSLLLLIVTFCVLYETNQRLKEQWVLISREVDAAKAMSRQYWQDPADEKCDEASDKLSKVGGLFERVEHQATMLGMGSTLNLDGTFKDLADHVTATMQARMENKDVWFKIVYIKGVVCALQQRATFMETATSPKMLNDLAERLEEPNTLNVFHLSPEMYASDPAGDCGKCRVEHGVFKMLHYATSTIGVPETKRRFFVISATRSYAKATAFERKVVAWKVAYD